MGREVINDEFTHLPISRQRKYQLRRQRDKLCTVCGKPAPHASRCIDHLVDARERQRKAHKCQRRYAGAKTYKLEVAFA